MKKILEQHPQHGLCLTDDYADLQVSVHEVDGLAIDDALEATVSTQRTMLFSCGQASRADKDELLNLQAIFQDEKVYSTFAAGTPIAPEEVAETYMSRYDRWQHGNPYSLFIIEDQEDGSFVGRIGMGGCDLHPITEQEMPGYSELGIVVSSAKQNMGFGSQAITALTYAWAPYVSKKSYRVNGEPLAALWATAHKDNGTAKIFDAAGYELKSSFIHPTYGKQRNEYALGIEDIVATCERSKMKFRA